MDLDEIKRSLRAEIKKRENEQYATFQCNVRQMCKDVLAKLEEQESEIDELIEKNERLSDDCLIKASNTFREIEKEMRHHKYKRCLGIAAVCFEKSYSTTLVKYDKESGYRLNFYDWWGKRWLKLAEKFKPNSTAKYGKGNNMEEYEMIETKHDLLTTKYTKVLEEKDFKYNAPHWFRVVRAKDGNVLETIHFQEGPIKECGVNGVCNEDLLVMVIRRLEGFQNSEFKCRENACAITKLEEALLWLRKRTMGRENRGVEGTNKV